MLTKKLLVILIVLAILSRFLGLEYIPPHLSNDEIGAAYAAYSISKTLKDGSNAYLPLLWKSNGGFGSPLAVYIPMISIIFLGNNNFAVRLPSAILGGLTIVLVGLLVMELTRNRKLAIVSSFLLAFSPWHFSASHRALESNYALFFIVLGLYLFFLGLNSNKLFALILGFISFALSIYSYYTEWTLTPLIIFSLLFLYRGKVLKNKYVYISILIFIILLVPLLFDFLQHLSSSRAGTEFIGNDLGVSRLLSKAPNFYTKTQIIAKAILDKYSSYISLSYLFFNGSKLLPKENPYQFGFMLMPFLVPFLIGIYKLKTFFKENTALVYSLFFLTPLTAAMTEGDLNNWRSLPQLLPLVLITGAGVLFFWDLIKKSLTWKTLSITLLCLSSIYFLLIYFKHSPIENAEGFQYGFKQIALYSKQHYNQYSHIIIDPRFGSRYFYYIGVPSSYIPFYNYIDPKEVQKAILIPGGISFDKYEFRNIDWSKEKVKKNFLYTVPSDNIPTDSRLKMVYEIFLPNHKSEFKLYALD